MRHYRDTAERTTRWWFDADNDRWRPSKWSTVIYHPRLCLLRWFRWRGLLRL